MRVRLRGGLWRRGAAMTHKRGQIEESVVDKNWGGGGGGGPFREGSTALESLTGDTHVPISERKKKMERSDLKK